MHCLSQSCQYSFWKKILPNEQGKSLYVWPKWGTNPSINLLPTASFSPEFPILKDGGERTIITAVTTNSCTHSESFLTLSVMHPLKSTSFSRKHPRTPPKDDDLNKKA